MAESDKIFKYLGEFHRFVHFGKIGGWKRTNHVVTATFMRAQTSGTEENRFSSPEPSFRLVSGWRVQWRYRVSEWYLFCFYLCHKSVSLRLSLGLLFLFNLLVPVLSFIDFFANWDLIFVAAYGLVFQDTYQLF